MAQSPAYKRRHTSVHTISPSLYLGGSGHSIFANCHMPQPQPSSPYKRPYLEQHRPQESSKRQKPNYPRGSQPPPAFWDDASKIWLTERTLKELDRRNTQSAPNSHCSPYRQFHRPVTRHTVAEWKNKVENWEPIQPATEFLTYCSVGYLEDIKSLARHGGPDLSDLRGYQKPANPFQYIMSSSKSSLGRRKRDSTGSSNTKPTTNTTTTRNTRPYDRGFQQNLVDHGIYPDGYRYPNGRVLAKPNNWNEINQRIAQPRASLSPSKFSDTEFTDFKQADVDASKEEQVTKSVIPIIEGKIKDGNCVSGKIPFTNLDYLTNGTLVSGNPDLWHGARPEQINPQVRKELSGYIIPSTQLDLPVAPNFFLEAKGPDGSIAVAGRQASYDGALGARGIHSLRSYGQDEPVYDNNAYTVTSIYHGGTLKMYTSHPTQPSGSGSRPEYFMTQIKGWSMTSDPETFRKGAAAFRNARDWTKEQRDEAIRQANERAKGRANDISSTTPTDSALASSFTTEVSSVIAATSLSIGAESQSQESPTTQIEASYTSETAHQESETSMDKLVRDVHPPAKRFRGPSSPAIKSVTPVLDEAASL